MSVTHLRSSSDLHRRRRAVRQPPPKIHRRSSMMFAALQRGQETSGQSTQHRGHGKSSWRGVFQPLPLALPAAFARCSSASRARFASASDVALSGTMRSL